MVRTVCCNLIGFAGQVLEQQVPEWREHPCAALGGSGPQAVVIGCNAAAADLGVRAGMRYTKVLEFAPQVHAAPVSETELHRQQERVAGALYALSDEVLRKPDEPGVLWVNVTGFALLYESVEAFVEQIRLQINKLGFRVRITAGCTRFGSYLAAVSDTAGASVVFRSVAEEQCGIAELPLAVAVAAQRPRERLARLGIKTFGALLRLPRSELRSRLGSEVEMICRMARGECDLPAEKIVPPAPRVETRYPEYPVRSSEQLLGEARELLDRQLQRLRRGECISSLKLYLQLDDGHEVCERVAPAHPVGSSRILLRLLRLRLEARTLERPAHMLRLEVTASPVPVGQKQLFAELPPERDLQRIEGVLAVLRAQLGEHAVCYLEPAAHHLPERRVRLRYGRSARARDSEPESSMKTSACGQIVRRAFVHPRLLSRGTSPPGVLSGPYLLSYDWWQSPARRLYYYCHPDDAADWGREAGSLFDRLGGREQRPPLRRPELALWVYYDLDSKCWMLQGVA